MGILSVGTDLQAVHAQENVDGEERRTGITVVERPVDQQSAAPIATTSP